MAFDSKRRFIAGAVCPRCSEMDKIVVYEKEGKDYRECVRCGFVDEMRFQQQVRELETRVNKTEEEKKSEVQVLQFPPLKSGDK
ncbi:YheV family putative metal-binding protein [Pseudomaricurvus alkylphenolicus]|uniref:YheV family putative zinc ribbon protein n=1 Tax=Pseudomaricurvus alkylphenolicus TaxID=1306991 RepID=UPI001423CA49|nr:YheV family putative zinc ribbon protein [Pseudomaricurvus alkylphenolicus]NIB39518.1 YheV family putative metal-binding protein [Pseudomaricurvus alkylphenolicus]